MPPLELKSMYYYGRDENDHHERKQFINSTSLKMASGQTPQSENHARLSKVIINLEQRIWTHPKLG